MRVNKGLCCRRLIFPRDTGLGVRCSAIYTSGQETERSIWRMSKSTISTFTMDAACDIIAIWVGCLLGGRELRVPPGTHKSIPLMAAAFKAPVKTNRVASVHQLLNAILGEIDWPDLNSPASEPAFKQQIQCRCNFLISCLREIFHSISVWEADTLEKTRLSLACFFFLPS